MADNINEEAALSQGKTFEWHELYVPSIQAAVDFYTTTLGFGTTTMEMAGHGAYTMLTRDGKPVCGIQSTESPQLTPGILPHWAVYLSVDDVDARLASVVEKGGKVVVPAMDVPTVGRMALVADPQGAHIWIFKSTT